MDEDAVHEDTVHEDTVHEDTVHEDTVHEDTVHEDTVHEDAVHEGHESIRIGQTPYGRGLFATQNLHAGKILGQVHGSIIVDPDYDSPYCIELLEDVSLEPEDPYALLNHSCDPNCTLVWIEGTDEIEYPGGMNRVVPDIIVETLADIRSGEQLTIDYRWPAEAAIACRCESASCRGWIVAEEELDRLCP